MQNLSLVALTRLHFASQVQTQPLPPAQFLEPGNSPSKAKTPASLATNSTSAGKESEMSPRSHPDELTQKYEKMTEAVGKWHSLYDELTIQAVEAETAVNDYLLALNEEKKKVGEEYKALLEHGTSIQNIREVGEYLSSLTRIEKEILKTGREIVVDPRMDDES